LLLLTSVNKDVFVGINDKNINYEYKCNVIIWWKSKYERGNYRLRWQTMILLDLIYEFEYIDG
jgi:hypothetical protein